jgi:hypothetical protein
MHPIQTSCIPGPQSERVSRHHDRVCTLDNINMCGWCNRALAMQPVHRRGVCEQRVSRLFSRTSLPLSDGHIATWANRTFLFTSHHTHSYHSHPPHSISFFCYSLSPRPFRNTAAINTYRYVKESMPNYAITAGLLITMTFPYALEAPDHVMAYSPQAAQAFTAVMTLATMGNVRHTPLCPAPHHSLLAMTVQLAVQGRHVVHPLLSLLLLSQLATRLCALCSLAGDLACSDCCRR